MKKLIIVISLSLGIIFSCKKNETPIEETNYNRQDTIIIKLKKKQGDGPFTNGAFQIDQFKPTNETAFKKPIYPDEITNYEDLIFFPDLKNRKVYILMLLVENDNEHYFIADENNNNDLTDDSLREIYQFNWTNSNDVIKLEYNIQKANELIQDSSWIKVGVFKDDIYLARSDYLVGSLEVGNNKYELGVIDSRNPASFTYEYKPKLALIGENNIIKDSIILKEQFSLGEFIKLNDDYYRFEKITRTGDELTLIREENFENHIGTQVGMIAPQFEVTTTKGAIIKSSDLSENYKIIANSCGCGGDKESTAAFYEINKRYKDVTVFRVDYDIDTTAEGIHIDSNNKFNKAFHDNYRKEYCSRITYVIGKNNRIIEKFEIFNWKDILPTFFENF